MFSGKLKQVAYMQTEPYLIKSVSDYQKNDLSLSARFVTQKYYSTRYYHDIVVIWFPLSKEDSTQLLRI